MEFGQMNLMAAYVFGHRLACSVQLENRQNVESLQMSLSRDADNSLWH